MHSRLSRRRILLFDVAVLVLTPWLVASSVKGQWVSASVMITPLTGLALAVALAVLRKSGVYHRLWSQAGVQDLERLLLGTGVSASVVALAATSTGSAARHQAIAAVLTVAAVVSFLAGPRILVALAARRRLRAPQHRAQHGARDRALIIGIGTEARQLAQALMERPQGRSTVPVGFLSDDAGMRKNLLLGLPIYATADGLAQVAQESGASQVLIATHDVGGDRIRDWFRQARAAGLAIRTVPSLAETSGQRDAGQRTEVRDIRIEDLLRRVPRRVDPDAIARLVAGRTVCVTGAGGSIGSELCRQLAVAGVRALVLVGRGENSIFEVERELLQRWPQVKCHPVILDVRDGAAIDRMLRRYSPSVMFHAAAHKHVPYMEHEPGEALGVNVVGTWRLAEACAAANIERFVLVSTDKAVSPVNIMGASKRAAELVVRGIAQRAGKPWAVVRFGNVLGSRGSVVPTFLQQIWDGGPVTLTDRRMTRYFMTIPEAASLVLEAAARADGEGVLYILDMGEPLCIADLAADVIRLAGYEPGVDMEVVETGLRPGELLHERLTRDDERLVPTATDGLLEVESAAGGTGQQVLAALPSIARDVGRGLRDDDEARAIIAMLVPEYGADTAQGTEAPVMHLISTDEASTAREVDSENVLPVEALARPQ
jgi:FlaA1/EpsC-like NDP-sugar epimerase